MVTIYRPIEQLKKLAEIARIPYTESQIVDFGLQLIKSTKDFETALGEWNKKSEDEKTWDNFKIHFQNAQQTLKDIRGPTMAQAGYQHANHLATELRNEFRENQTQMLALMQNLSEKEQEIEHDNQVEDDKVLAANAATQMSMQAETLKVLVQLQKQLETLANNVQSGKGKGRRG